MGHAARRLEPQEARSVTWEELLHLLPQLLAPLPSRCGLLLPWLHKLRLLCLLCTLVLLARHHAPVAGIPH